MKARITISILTIILLVNIQLIFSSNIQTSFEQDKSNCDSSYPDACISSPPPNLNCKDISDKDFDVLPPDPMNLTMRKMI